MDASEVKSAIVTGASNGIGKQITVCLLKQGYKVFNLDIDSENGLKTEKELNGTYGATKVQFLKCDVSKESDLKSSFEEIIKRAKHISILVNNAGLADEFNIEKCVGVNLIGMIRGTNLAIEHMRKDKGGEGGIIISVASMAAVESYHILPTYCATKSGVLNFTLSWSKHPKVPEMGLKFMCLCPGFVDTSLTKFGGPKTLDPSAFDQAKTAVGLLSVDAIENAFNQLLKDQINGSVLEASTIRTGYLTDPYLMKSIQLENNQ